MDKFLIRNDIYDKMIEKGYGKRDLSKLQKVQITDKNGHVRSVYKKTGLEQNEQKLPNTLTPEKKAHYEEMLEKVKAGSDENALFVRGKGMLNKADAIAHLEEKLGKTNNNEYENVSPERKTEIENAPKEETMKDHESKSDKDILDAKVKENFKKDAKKLSDKGLEQKIKNLTTPGSIDYQVYSNPEQIAEVFKEELEFRNKEKQANDDV